MLISEYSTINGYGNRIQDSMIQAPYTLAKLPLPLHASQGKTLAADVYTVAGSKKRKRSELAVAVDYEGINIYDV